MSQEVTIKVPSWVAADELFALLGQDLQFKLAYFDSQCRHFQQKHERSFAEFEAALRASAQEDLDNWEDFMDWETAESAREEMAQRLQELAT